MVTHSPQPPVFALASDTEARWIGFSLTPGNQIRFQMSVNGVPATAILDTGVNQSVLSRSFARDNGLLVTASGNARAIGGTVAIGSAVISSLQIGGLSRTGGRLSVVELPSNATGSTRPIDLLVGADILSRYAIDIDYEHARFRLLRSGRMPFRGQSAPLTTDAPLGLLLTETAIGNVRQRPMIVDTGDGASITFARRNIAGTALDNIPHTSAIAYGLGGALITDLFIVPTVSIGEMVARDVEVHIEPPTGYSSTIGVAGRVGNGLLSRYRVLIDLGSARIIFGPNKNGERAVVRSTSGLQTATEPNRLRVLHVMRASPAEAAGWHANDLICTVDGQAVDQGYESSGLSAWTIGAPGRVVDLGLCDGSFRLLTLRQFY